MSEIALAVVGVFAALWGPRHQTIALGQPVPEMELPLAGGGRFQLSRSRGRFVLLCFLRSEWCACCHVMMRIFEREARQLAAYGVRLVVVSPDPQASDRDAVGGTGHPVVWDEGGALAASWGIGEPGRPGGRLASAPVSLLVDPDGILRDVSEHDDVSSWTGKSSVLRFLDRVQEAGPIAPTRSPHPRRATSTR